MKKFEVTISSLSGGFKEQTFNSFDNALEYIRIMNDELHLSSICIKFNF